MINRLAGIGRVEAYGSVLRPSELDSWSDLDVRIALTAPIDIAVLGLDELWSWQDIHGESGQTLRLVLVDGRRIDLSVSSPADRSATGSESTPANKPMIIMPTPASDNQLRFDAALAASRYGRGNQLIGLHLTLDILREALVVAMLLRDRAEGTDHHRVGGEFEDRAAEVTKIISESDPHRRPTIVERSCELYGRWRSELEENYRPDWSGLSAVIDLGTGRSVNRRTDHDHE